MNRIKELREGKNLSQAELAAQLGIDARLLAQYETDLTPLPALMLQKLADFFRVSTRRVSGLDEVNPTAQRMRQVALSDATEIAQETEIANVNLRLSEGWKLLHIGQVTERGADWSEQAYVVYTLGWFGARAAARGELPEDSRTILA